MSEAITRLNAALEGRYRIESELGEGGMATVYLADDIKHERKVALKVLKPELAAVVGAERFLAEIKTTAKLTHPNILPLFDSGEADSHLFYVMPYVKGDSLRDRLDREHQLPVDEAVRIAISVAEALDHAHREGVIHRDIKPGNILLQDGQPVVADFGIALAVSVEQTDRLTQSGVSVGTSKYMSPEQATGEGELGPASDIYSLGCVLYEMLSGDPPHTGSARAVLAKMLTQRPTDIRQIRDAVPGPVSAALETALARVSADRFATAAEFADALAVQTTREDVGQGKGPEGDQASIPESTAIYNAVTKHWPKIALGSIGAAVGAGFTFGRIEGVSFQSYIFTWAMTTAGIWFLFDKTEAAMSARSRKQVVGWLGRPYGSALEAIPAQFELLFDRIFGERHLSVDCFAASCGVSLYAAVVMFGFTLTTDAWLTVPAAPLAFPLLVWVLASTAAFARVSLRWFPKGRVVFLRWPIGWKHHIKPMLQLIVLYLGLVAPFILFFEFRAPSDSMVEALLGVSFGFFALALFNFLPDYLSLLETRWAIRWMGRGKNVFLVLLLDFGLTCVAWTVVPSLILLLARPSVWPDYSVVFMILAPLRLVFQAGVLDVEGPVRTAVQLSFVTTFATSAWLWLYMMSVFLSRALLRMNNGVGFLLRATDVEKQPFRSMGFVSVIIVSALFALGLPLVLL